MIRRRGSVVALFSAVLTALLASTISAEAAHRRPRHSVRVPVFIEGVGHLAFCPAPPRRR